jgi:hypothetical protein
VGHKVYEHESSGQSALLLIRRGSTSAEDHHWSPLRGQNCMERTAPSHVACLAIYSEGEYESSRCERAVRNLASPVTNS